jgi:hypothetical protein
MYQEEKLHFRHRLAEVPLRMPVNSLLCLPRYTTSQYGDLIFNPFAAVATVFQNHGWERATKIMAPSIWAPGWMEDQVLEFARSAPPGQVKPTIHAGRELMQEVFPGAPSQNLLAKPEHREFPIIHFTGNLAYFSDGSYGLDLGVADGGVIGVKTLLQSTSEARTRLLILQVLDAADFLPATLLGRELVSEGGPVVLVVFADQTGEITRGFTEMYFNLSHNHQIPELVKYAWSSDGTARLHFIYGEGAESLLQFSGFVEEVRHEYDRVRDTTARQFSLIDDFEKRTKHYLHDNQHQAFKKEAMAVRSMLQEMEHELESSGEQLEEASNLVWAHESEGVVPLSMSSETIERAEMAMASMSARFADLEAELEREMSHAPRVLNVNFADPNSGRVLALKDGLVAGGEYYLLVDVGPRWNKIVSAVVGEALFPEEALPSGEDGYLVEVMLISEDFSPQLSSAQMWVPRSTGRSYPIISGRRAEKPGPVALKVYAPMLPDDFEGKSLFAHSRLCLYYENNLLQSALVTAGVVVTEGVRLETNNKVDVDYVLSRGFQDVEAIFSKREVKLGAPSHDADARVALNLALNDDGAGGHRIIVKGSHDPLSELPGVSPNRCPPNGWTPYDPVAGSDLLENARQSIINCFFEKHAESGDQFGKLVLDRRRKPVYGLTSDNSKIATQFKIDLLLLAELGYDLWATAFDQVKFEGNLCNLIEWRRNFKSILSNSTLIQISRTGPAQYVFPWTMVYEYPLNRSERSAWRMCKIIDEEWSPEGIRLEAEKEREICRYHGEDWHRNNIICPYGFWGLKHIIEEPPSLPFGDGSSLDNVAKEILVGRDIDISIAITEDINLDRSSIERHITRLGSMPGVLLNRARPKQDWEGLRPLLRSPEIVYLLCHGEYDDLVKEPYLSIGPRDGGSSHRIYPKGTLASWMDDEVEGPDISHWKQRRPLIIINGCHTADLRPGQIVSFASTFAGVGAGGVLGTEVSVTLPVAIEVAESLIGKLTSAENISLGEALRQIRWQLANKGNLLGLAYTLYGLADIHIKRNGR